MGSVVSRKSDIDFTECLIKFTGREAMPLSQTDFWVSLLSFSTTIATNVRQDQRLFEQAKYLCNQLTTNNLKSGNFGTLLHIFLDKATTLHNNSQSSEVSFSEVENCLFLIRLFLQHLIQKCPQHDVVRHINVKGIPDLFKTTSNSMVVSLTNKLLDIISTVPLHGQTYTLHCEAVNTVILLMSSHLFTTLKPAELEVYRVVYETKLANNLCKILIQRFIQQLKNPKEYGGSILIGLASEFIGLFSSTQAYSSPIAVKSLLLCTVLITHNVGLSNKYKDYLFAYAENVADLYNAICNNIDREETTLLLYHLVHRNKSFREYLLERPDIDTLIAPMLQTIYFASSDNCPHMYLSLIVLLILTEDLNFNKRVHSIVLRNISWYTERSLNEITLGGLLILVTTRAVQYNLLKMRDEYLHTNCLAALANMSSQFVNLQPYVCQRLVGLFELLAKTYTMAKEELVAIERALRIILEVLNSCLSNQIIRNPNLIYALLYKKSIFESFNDHPAFQDIIQNINQVLQYFVSKIEEDKDLTLDVEIVLKIIETSAAQLPTHRLQKFPELKFKYVEEENPDDFFIPYVWSLITKYSCIYWLPSSCSSF